MPSLAQQLSEQNAGARERIPTDTLAVMDAATDQVASSGLVDSAVGVGARAPEFTLPDAGGTKVALADLLTNGPVVLAFYRGGWCPYCNLELRALQAALPEIEAAGGSLVAISPELPDNSLSTKERLELAFTVLSDVGNEVAERYGLVFTIPEALRAVYDGFGIDLPASNGDASFRLPVPATYVLAPDGTVAWRFAHPDYTKRAEPADVVEALRAL